MLAAYFDTWIYILFGAILNCLMSLQTHKHVIIFVRLAISLFLVPFFDPIISPVFASITAQHFDDTFGCLNSLGTYLLKPGPVFPNGEELLPAL